MAGVPGQAVDLTAGNNAAGMAAATNLVVKAAPGTLYGFTVYNAKASAQFIQLHDATALPSDTAVPVLSLAVAATSNLVVDLGVRGKSFSTGIVICNSSTVATKTVGSADCSFEARYR